MEHINCRFTNPRFGSTEDHSAHIFMLDSREGESGEDQLVSPSQT